MLYRLLTSTKHALKRCVPRSVVEHYHSLVRARRSRQNAQLSAREVFSRIYATNEWGEDGDFCSGSGSRDPAIVAPYVEAIKRLAADHGGKIPTLIDLGCGDFFVGRQLLGHCEAYHGVDVAPALVEHLVRTEGRSSVSFSCLDIVEEELPSGDVCLVRQVLQHLSNDQVAAALRKLRRYPTVVITEHYPSEGRLTKPNLDKVHGGDIRLFDGSGVYLDQPPFNRMVAGTRLLVEAPGHSFGDSKDPGVIRTYVLTWREDAAEG